MADLHTVYLGRIASVPGRFGFGFIGIGTVTKDDGSPHGIDTDCDIFIHQDNCEPLLRIGAPVRFMVVPDRKRGKGAYRAIGAGRAEADISRFVGCRSGEGIEIRLPGGAGTISATKPFANMAADLVAEMMNRRDLERNWPHLMAAGFVRVDGLIARYPFGGEEYVIYGDSAQFGRWEQRGGFFSLITTHGAVWLRPVYWRGLKQEQETFAKIISDFAPNGQGAFVPCSNGEYIEPYYLLCRASNPWYEMPVETLSATN